MNVLFVARGYPQERNNMLGMFELDQAIALKHAGHRVAYAAIDIRSLRRKRKLGYNHFVDDNGIEVFEMNWPIGGIQQDLADFFCGKCFEKLYSHIKMIFGKPDIIHAHFLKIGTAAKGVCNQEHIPLVLTEHSSLINNENLPQAVIRRAKKTYSVCDMIIAVSHPLSENIKKTTGYESTVIHNIVNVGNVITNDSMELHNVGIKFVSAGNLIHMKGFDILLHAFADANKKEPNMTLEIFGDGPESNNLKALVKKLKIEDKVAFKGRYKKEDISRLFSGATAFVLASRAETFGVVYIEAMALGLPVIATKCGGPEDFIDDNTGYLVDVENIDELSFALTRMAAHYKDFSSKFIKEYAFMNFSEKNIADQIAGVYRNVLRQKGLPDYAG